VNRPPGNFPGDHAESDGPREGESADAADPNGEALPRRPSDPPEAWDERTQEAEPISEQADPVDISTDEGEGITDEVTPPIAVAPRALDEAEYQDSPPALMVQKFREHEVEATQEISPEELEIQPLPQRVPSEPRQAPAASPAQLALSDLFDSAPAPGSVTLAPPNVAEFASSRPPPASGATRPEPIRRPTPAGAGVVALPSIPVSGDKPVELTRPSAPPTASAHATSPQPASVGRLPSQPGFNPTRTPSQPFVASPGRERMPSSPGFERNARERMPSSPGREQLPSSPGRERMASSPAFEVNARELNARELRDSTPPPRDATPTPPRALDKSPSPAPPPAAVPDDSEPLTPPKPVVARAPTEAEAREAPPPPAPDEAPALTPTPAVHGMPAAGPRPQSRPALQPGARRPLTPPAEPQSLIAAPAASRQPGSSNSLPSVVLSPAIETDSENEQPSMKAIRSTRATVRLSSVEALDILRQARASSSPPPTSSAPQISTRPLSPASMRALMLRTKPWSWIAAAGVVLVLLLVWILWPSTGALMVTVSGPGGAPVEGVKVLVDGNTVCESSPCRIESLDDGVHRVRATALGMAETAEEAVRISGGEAVHNIRLAATVGETGGLQISAGDEPLTLVLDGKVVGPLPQKLTGLTPGEHWLKLESTTGEPPIEKGVVIGAGEILQVEPERLKSNKTLVTIELSRESEGATVTLNDDFLLDFPAELELVPGEPHELHATKPGFKDYKTQIKIAPGEASKHLIVDLEPLQGNRARQRSASRPATGAPPKPKATAASSTSTASGLLNINSTPPSSVILNGKPLGTTPRIGVEVPGNSMQTVIFVHPTMGRRRAQQIVPAGQTKTISIRF
jgi:PEGA domain-containing protein